MAIFQKAESDKNCDSPCDGTVSRFEGGVRTRQFCPSAPCDYLDCALGREAGGPVAADDLVVAVGVVEVRQEFDRASAALQ